MSHSIFLFVSPLFPCCCTVKTLTQTHTPTHMHSNFYTQGSDRRFWNDFRNKPVNQGQGFHSSALHQDTHCLRSPGSWIIQKFRKTHASERVIMSRRILLLSPTSTSLPSQLRTEDYTWVLCLFSSLLVSLFSPTCHPVCHLIRRRKKKNTVCPVIRFSLWEEDPHNAHERTKFLSPFNLSCLTTHTLTVTTMTLWLWIYIEYSLNLEQVKPERMQIESHECMREEILVWHEYNQFSERRVLFHQRDLNTHLHFLFPCQEVVVGVASCCVCFPIHIVLQEAQALTHCCSLLIPPENVQECTATNDVSKIKHSARLKILGPPFIRSMNNVTAKAGESFTFHCPVSGHPIESIYWEKGMSLFFFPSCLLAFDSYFISSSPAGNTLPRNPIDILFSFPSFALRYIFDFLHTSLLNYWSSWFMRPKCTRLDSIIHMSIGFASKCPLVPLVVPFFPARSKASDPIRMLMFSCSNCLSWGYFSGCII